MRIVNEFEVNSLIEFLAGERLFEFEIEGTGTVVGRIAYAVAEGSVLAISGHEGYVSVNQISNIEEVTND